MMITPEYEIEVGERLKQLIRGLKLIILEQKRVRTSATLTGCD
jgi:hypothetical protein